MRRAPTPGGACSHGSPPAARAHPARGAPALSGARHRRAARHRRQECGRPATGMAEWHELAVPAVHQQHGRRYRRREFGVPMWTSTGRPPGSPGSSAAGVLPSPARATSSNRVCRPAAGCRRGCGVRTCRHHRARPGGWKPSRRPSGRTCGRERTTVGSSKARDRRTTTMGITPAGVSARCSPGMPTCRSSLPTGAPAISPPGAGPSHGAIGSGRRGRRRLPGRAA